MKHDFTSCRVSAFLALMLLAAVASAADRRVLIIGIDGLRADSLEQAVTPAIDSLFKDGAGYYSRGFNEDATVSMPNWSTVLHGVHVDRHRITDNSGPSPGVFTTYPNLFYRLEQFNSSLNTTAVYTWDYLEYNFALPGSLDSKTLYNMLDPSGFEGVDWDSDHKAAAELANQLTNGDPHAAYLYLGMPDIVGHRGGFFPTTPRYMQQLAETDADVGTVLTALRNRPGVISGDEEWLVLLTTDHGGEVSHVENVYKTREIPFIVSGPGVYSEVGPLQPRNVDVAKTALTWMGVPETSLQDLDGHVIGLTPPPANALGFHQNLIVNGDGEYDRGFSKQTMDQAIGGWQDQQQYPANGFQTMTLMTYDAPGGYPTMQDPGPDDRGSNFFVAGSQGATSRMTQTIDVSTLAGVIDTNTVGFELSGWLGGYINQNDVMRLTAFFQDQAGNTLEWVRLGPVTAADRGNQTGLFYLEETGLLPAGTRSVLIELRATLSVGMNDAYADNLSFVLTPEPGTLVLSGFPVIVLAALARRRRVRIRRAS